MVIIITWVKFTRDTYNQFFSIQIS